MIIVSQDKNMTTECLELEIIDRDIGFAIYSYGLCEDIGIYKTEERAKEVLEEIIKCYANTEQYKCLSGMPNCASEEKVNVLNKLAENAVIYEMPQE